MISGQQIDVNYKRYVTLPLLNMDLSAVISTEASVVVENREENFEN
jgi:hypothetical protein